MIRKGDVILQKGDDLGSFLIRLVTGSPYTHAAMYVGNGMMVHSTLLTGTVLVYYDTWFEFYAKKTSLDIYRPLPSLAGYLDKVIHWAIRRTGRPYDLMGVLGFVIPAARQNSRLYFCSELVAEAWEEIADIKLVDKPVHKIAPGDLAESPYLKLVHEGVGLEELRIQMRVETATHYFEAK
jgi:uncharacterized protein YycO